MCIAFPQAIAPAFVTSLFAYSLKSNIAGGNLVWIILLAISEPRPVLLVGVRWTIEQNNIIAATSAFLHSLTLREPWHDWRDGYKAQVEDE